MDKNTKFASVCVLAYQRPEFLMRTMESLLSVDSGYPMEIIVSDDGSEDTTFLYSLLTEKKISYLLLNGGKNRGIGEAVRNCFKVASGDYLFKLDADLEFKEGWLKTAIDILDTEEIGCVSLLNYNNYDPKDDRFYIIGSQHLYTDYLSPLTQFFIVNDFISCLYGVKREIYNQFKNLLSTDGWHQVIRSQGYLLAISQEDMITNFGFGLGKSIYVKQNEKGEIVTTETHKEPLIF